MSGCARRSGSTWLLMAALLAGCSSAPRSTPAVSPTDEVAPVSLSAPAAAFEKSQRERAALLTKQGRLADLALTLEVLGVLRPDVPEYAERLAEVRRNIDTAVAERLPRAAQAQRKGDLDAASTQYLAVMALQPDNTVAADALRAIERERNKRTYLGKYARLTLTKRAMSEAEVRPSEPDPRDEERNADLEHASLLSSQGEYADAIALLEKRLAAGKNDSATSQMLADAYYQQALAWNAAARAQAVKSLERAVQLNPKHAAARLRLAELKRAAAAAPRVAAPATAASSPLPKSAKTPGGK